MEKTKKIRKSWEMRKKILKKKIEKSRKGLKIWEKKIKQIGKTFCF